MLSSIFAAGARDIGSLIDLQWQGAGGAGVICGWKGASFPSFDPAAASTLTIKQGVAANVAIAFAGTEASASDCAATINGFAGVTGTPAMVGTDGALNLVSAGRIEVISMTPTMFGKLGLPKMIDDPAAALGTSTVLPISDSGFTMGAPLRLLSVAIPVPKGANLVTLFPSLMAPTGIMSDRGYSLTPMWFRTGDTASDPLTSGDQTRFPLVIEDGVEVSSTNADSQFGLLQSRWQVLRVAGMGTTGSIPGDTSLVLPVPPHAAMLRVAVNPMFSLKSPPNAGPQEAPTFRCKAGFGYG